MSFGLTKLVWQHVDAALSLHSMALSEEHSSTNRKLGSVASEAAGGGDVNV